MEDTANARTAGRDCYRELEDMAAHICDKLCRHPLEIMDQEELDAVCERCLVSTCLGRIFAAEQAGKSIRPA